MVRTTYRTNKGDEIHIVHPDGLKPVAIYIEYPSGNIDCVKPSQEQEEKVEEEEKEYDGGVKGVTCLDGPPSEQTEETGCRPFDAQAEIKSLSAQVELLRNQHKVMVRQIAATNEMCRWADRDYTEYKSIVKRVEEIEKELTDNTKRRQNLTATFCKIYQAERAQAKRIRKIMEEAGYLL